MSFAAPFEIDVEQWEGMSPAEQAEAARELQAWNDACKANPLLTYFPHQGELEFKLKEQSRVLERWARKGYEIVVGEGSGGLQYSARSSDGEVRTMPAELVLDGDESRGQLEFHERTLTSDVVAAVAGNRFGKSHVGCADILIQILPLEFIPPWLKQFRRRDEEFEYYARAIGVDLANWLEKAIKPKLRKLIPAAALAKGEFDKSFNERMRKLEFADGSWLDFLTHDMDIDSYASADLDHVLFDEEPPGEKGKQQVDETYGRIADRDGRVRWTLTPLLGLSHVYYELTDDQGNPRRDDEVWVVTGDIDHNPHMSERGKRKFLKRFKSDPLKMQARKSGRWVHFAGRIYEEFEETDFDGERGHLCAPRPIPREHEGAKPSVPIREWIDPGIDAEHPAAYGAAWINADDTLEIFHTFKMLGGTARDMAEHIKETRRRFDFKPSSPVVIDPSARNKHHATGRSTQDEYKKNGIHVRLGQNDRIAGINAMKERFKTHRIRLHRDCHEFEGAGVIVEADLAEEWRDYRWKGNKRSSAEDAPKPEPIKKKDDLADGCRYLVMDLRPARPKAEEEHEDRMNDGERALRDNLRRIRRRGRRRARIGGVV